MIGNPFAPHAPAPAEVFVNREREIDLVFGHIQAVQRGNVAVNGPLGIGKSSLLRHIADPATAAAHGVASPPYALVYMDVQSVTPFSADRFWRRVAQLVARAPGLDMRAPVDRLLARDTLDVIDIEELLDAFVDRRMALVLLLDEFEWALQADTPETEAESRNFLAQMASLARRTPKVLALVVSTDAPLFEATRVIESWRGSPFATIFTSLTLKPLTPEDANDLIDRALAGGAVVFNDDDRRRLYKLSAGQPAALQSAAFSLYHGLQQGLVHAHLWEAAQQAALQALAYLNTPPPVEARPAPPPAALPSGPATPGAAQPHGLWIDAATGEVAVNGRRVESLTALEYSLLRLLFSQPGRLCSKADIIRQVWGEEFMGEDDDSRVEKLISRLRRKIEPVPSRPQYLRTVRGRGYRYVP